MNLPEAKHRVAQMFAAHAKAPADVIVAEYARAVLDAGCHACAATTLDDVRLEGKTVPTVPSLRAAWRARQSNAAHLGHIGVTDREAEVGTTEAFWRGEGADVIERITGLSRDHARLLSAGMWHGMVPADAWYVGEECEPIPLSFWLRCYPEATAERVEEMFAAARVEATRKEHV